MRLIDADELWGKMYRYIDNEGAKMPYGDDDSLIHKDSACFLIENALTIEPEPQWIPIGERLPEDGSTCLISLKSPFAKWVSHAIFSMNGDLEYFDSKAGEGGFYSYDSEYGYYKREGVIAWMPMPEPYREKE